MYTQASDSVKNRQLSARHPKFADYDAYHILDIEIDDHGAAVCKTGICESSPGNIQLFTYSEIPDFLKGNPWVVDGYRAFLPFGLCMKRCVFTTRLTQVYRFL